MYLDYFGLTQPPFKITPDTNLFYAGGNRGAVLEALMYAIKNGEGIVKVVGEVGTGKTMLCRMLEVELDDNIEVVYLANPSVSPDQIPYAIAFELKLEIAASSNRLQVMNELQNYLLNKHAQNKQVVVFVEEAQSMPIASLEELRLLSNLETSQSKLLQIVLFGQPELDEMIASTDIRQLKERITYSFQLAPFKTPDIKEYLNARVRACGYRGGELFTAGCVREMTRYSNGLLRRVNILADKSLLSAYATGKKKVLAEHVKTAARDSEFVTLWQRIRWPISVAALLLIACVLGSIVYLNQQQSVPTVAAKPSVQTPPPQVDKVEPVSQTPPVEPVEIVNVQPSEKTVPDRPQPTAQPVATEAAVTTVSEEKKKIASDALILKSDDQVAPAIEAAAEPVSQVPAPAQSKLLALENIIKQQDLGPIKYSESELSMMIDQLEKIPSESIIEDGDSEAECENCASLIYRPLYKKENL